MNPMRFKLVLSTVGAGIADFSRNVKEFALSAYDCVGRFTTRNLLAWAAGAVTIATLLGLVQHYFPRFARSFAYGVLLVLFVAFETTWLRPIRDAARRKYWTILTAICFVAMGLLASQSHWLEESIVQPPAELPSKQISCKPVAPNHVRIAIADFSSDSGPTYGFFRNFWEKWRRLKYDDPSIELVKIGPAPSAINGDPLTGGLSTFCHASIVIWGYTRSIGETFEVEAHLAYLPGNPDLVMDHTGMLSIPMSIHGDNSTITLIGQREFAYHSSTLVDRIMASQIEGDAATVTNYLVSIARGLSAYQAARYAEAAYRFQDTIDLIAASPAHELSAYLPYYYLGNSRLRLLDYVGAIDAYNHSVDLNSTFPDALVGIGDVEVFRGEFRQAKRHFKVALQMDQKSVLARVDLADVELQTGDFPDAIEDCKLALSTYRDLGACYLTIGDAYLRSGHTNRALNEYRVAQTLGLGASLPVGSHLYNVLPSGRDQVVISSIPEIGIDPIRLIATEDIVALMITSAKFDNAASELNTLNEAEPRNADIVGELGFVADSAGDHTTALSDFFLALIYGGDVGNISANIGATFSELKDARQSVFYYRQAAALEPSSTNFSNLGTSEVDIGDLRRAFVDLNFAIYVNSKDPLPYVGRSDAYARIGQRQRAIEDLSTAITMGLISPTLYYKRGLLWSESRKYATAIGDITRAIDLNPSAADAEMYYNRGVDYGAIGNSQKAISDYTASLLLKPRYFDALVNRGAEETSIGEVVAAHDDFIKALSVNPSGGIAWFDIARLRCYIGQLAWCLLDLQKSVQIWYPPDNLALYWGVKDFSEFRFNDANAQLSYYLARVPSEPLALELRGLSRIGAGYNVGGKSDLAKSLVVYKRMNLKSAVNRVSAEVLRL